MASVKRANEDSDFSSQDPAFDSSNTDKKVKLDTTDDNQDLGGASSATNVANAAPEPGRVLHVRNMPLDVTEQELIAIGARFGRVVNSLLMHNKGQGFIEFDSAETAKGVLASVTETNPQQIRGRRIYFQTSPHAQLKRNDNHSQANGGSSSSGGSDSQLEPKPVLRVEIHNVLYVVTLDVLHQIFSKYGQVLRIITFTKNNVFQALIQYSSVESSKNAKINLDGQSIYTGCCQLRIFFSRLDELNVKFNNDKSRDYTNPNLPSGDSLPFGGGAGAGPSHVGRPMGGAAGGYGAAAPGGYGFAAAAGPQGQHYVGGGAPGYGNMYGAAGGAGSSAGNGGYGPSPLGRNVLLVSNLNEQAITPDILFMLIGVYADVHRVKILYNKKDTALVLVTDAQQAQTALNNLNGQVFFGKDLRISISKHNSVALPRPGAETEAHELTKEYVNSPLHRFKIPGSKNFANICPPCDTLHITNIPENFPENDLMAEFSKFSHVLSFRFLPNNRKMGLIKFGSIDEAMQALVRMNNYKINPTTYLRVSFSKISA